MTITSVNHNPNNDSKYARRKSIFKGQRNQLKDWVQTLRGLQGVQTYEYVGPPAKILPRIAHEWGDNKINPFGAKRHQGTFMNSNVARGPVSQKLKASLPDGRLQADLALIWNDVNDIYYRRFGNLVDDLQGGTTTEGQRKFFQTGEAVIVWAPGPASFDLIISKHGYSAPGFSKSPHYYIWQSRLLRGMFGVPVDDYGEGED